jgi:lipopolysaccharide/colanic/teichoic acid biosynthesis glycosyltransferase
MIYAMDTLGKPEVAELIVHEWLLGIPLVSALGLYEGITGRMPYQCINATSLIEECLRNNRFTQIRIKSLLDRTIGALLLLLCLPIMLVCALLIKRESSGPVFFTQQRIGKFGKPFTMYKLRTMRPASHDQPAEAEGWHHAQEARITESGRFLRRFHLDELPQLFNVVKGDMSLVGPRPEMEIFIRMCEKEIPFYRLRLDVKPGITGWAQVAFRHTSRLESYREKFEYDLYYLSHLSLGFDLDILVRTVSVLYSNPSR